MKLVIKEKIESQNKFNNRRGFGAQYVYKRYRDGWFMEVLAALPAGSHDSHGDKKKRVVITSYRMRLLDKGNLYGGAKPILDGLVRYGIIRDDSPKWCDEEVKQVQVARANEKTVVEILEIEE